jgi:hypothetical protein
LFPLLALDKVLMRGLATEQLTPEDSAPGTAVAAAFACERMCRTLSRTLGAIGSRALLMRALSQAQAEHRALKEVSVSAKAAVALDGISLATAAHGEPAVVAGLEGVLSALLALLGRLIGKDMVARLVAQSAPLVIAEEGDK